MTDKANLPAKQADHEDMPVVFTPPESFEVVDRGSAEVVRFTHFGDQFVGIFEYTEQMEDEEGKQFSMAVFTGADGRPYCIFPGASLERALKRLTPGTWARITYHVDIDTGRPSPMKSFIVEAGR